MRKKNGIAYPNPDPNHTFWLPQALTFDVIPIRA
jgi:hypothetical protein